MKNLLQKLIKPRQSQELSKNQLQSQSPNLLNYRFTDTNFLVSNQDQIIKLFRYPILAIQIVFIIIVIANFITNKQLNAAEGRISVLEANLLEKSDIYEQSRQVQKQIDRYKAVESTRLVYNKRAEELISLLPQSVDVKSLTLKRGDTTSLVMLTKLEVSDALSVALLINRFLEVPDVEHVVLSSASLLTYKNSYEVALEVGMR